jgi:hypothetical protein
MGQGSYQGLTANRSPILDEIPDWSKTLRAWPPTAIVADADASMRPITAALLH